jgi:hypothetical protein
MLHYRFIGGPLDGHTELSEESDDVEGKDPPTSRPNGYVFVELIGGTAYYRHVSTTREMARAKIGRP